MGCRQPGCVLTTMPNATSMLKKNPNILFWIVHMSYSSCPVVIIRLCLPLCVVLDSQLGVLFWCFTPSFHARPCPASLREGFRGGEGWHLRSSLVPWKTLQCGKCAFSSHSPVLLDLTSCPLLVAHGFCPLSLLLWVLVHSAVNSEI